MSTEMQKFRAVFRGEAQEYSYLWAGDEELKVGDKVETPPPRWADGLIAPERPPGVATVVALGSDYQGTMTVLRRRA